MNNMILKSQLSAQQMVMVQSEFDKKKKSKGIMYALWWFTGLLGGHRFYLGDVGRGIAILLLGWVTLFIWPLLDVFVIGKRLDEINNGIEIELIQIAQAIDNK